VNNDKLIPVEDYPDDEDLNHAIAALTMLITKWHYVSDKKLLDNKIMCAYESMQDCYKRLKALKGEIYEPK